MMNLKDIISYLGTKKFWVELIIMTLGMVVTACAVYYFLVPSKLIIGTISGLSIVISGICEQFFGFPLNVSTVIFVINAILLILAYILIDKEFGIKTVYTALILGPLIGVLEKYFPYENYTINAYNDDADDLPEEFDGIEGQIPLKKLVIELTRESDGKVVETVIIDRLSYEEELDYA